MTHEKLETFVRELARQHNELEEKVTGLAIKVESLEHRLDVAFGEQVLLERVRELEHATSPEAAQRVKELGLPE